MKSLFTVVIAFLFGCQSEQKPIKTIDIHETVSSSDRVSAGSIQLVFGPGAGGAVTSGKR